MTRVSILIPMHNAQAYVGATLRSLLAQEGLDPRLDEIVIVDDGSTDLSRSVVDEVSREAPAGDCIRVIVGPRHGISAAMNAGLASARGRWVCRCDADDLYPPDRLRRQLSWLAEHLEFGAVCGGFSTINARGRPIAEFPCGDDEQEITEELRKGQTRTHFCTFLGRPEAIRAAGGFRPWFVTGEDIDMQLRLAGACRIGFQPAAAYLYRLHDDSITHRQDDGRRVFYETAARIFAAQRRAGGVDDLARGSPPSPPAAQDRTAGSSSRQAQQVLIGASWRHHKDGRKVQALVTGLRACLARPGAIGAWKNLCTLALKRT